jgi:replicative superfamily II helicase
MEKKLEDLNLIEMSQIAGRAGRYKNDGGFGTQVIVKL